MAEQIKPDYSQMLEIAQKMEKRVVALEYDNFFLEREILKIEVKTQFIKYKTAEEITTLRSEISSLKNLLKEYTLEMIKLSRDIKQIIKKEQYSQINDRIDQIQFNNYITKKELLRYGDEN